MRRKEYSVKKAGTIDRDQPNRELTLQSLGQGRRTEELRDGGDVSAPLYLFRALSHYTAVWDRRVAVDSPYFILRYFSIFKVLHEITNQRISFSHVFLHCLLFSLTKKGCSEHCSLTFSRWYTVLFTNYMASLFQIWTIYTCSISMKLSMNFYRFAHHPLSFSSCEKFISDEKAIREENMVYLDRYEPQYRRRRIQPLHSLWNEFNYLSTKVWVFICQVWGSSEIPSGISRDCLK